MKHSGLNLYLIIDFLSSTKLLKRDEAWLCLQICKLSIQDGHCFASNSYLGIKTGISDLSKISKMLAHLKSLSLIDLSGLGRNRIITPLLNNFILGQDNQEVLNDVSFSNNLSLVETTKVNGQTLVETTKSNNLSLVETTNPTLVESTNEHWSNLPITPVPPISEEEGRKKEGEEGSVCATPPNLQSPSSKPKPIVAPLLISKPPASSVAPLPHPSAFAPLMSEPPFFRNFKNTRLTESEYAQLCGEFGTKFVDERLPRFDKTAQFFKGSHHEKLLEWCKKDYDISKDERLEKKIPPVRNPETRPKIESTSHFLADDAEITQKNRHFTEQFVLREKIIAPFVEILPFGVVCKVPGKLKFIMQWIEPGFQSQFDGWFRKADLDGSFSFHGVKTH